MRVHALNCTVRALARSLVNVGVSGMRAVLGSVLPPSRQRHHTLPVRPSAVIELVSKPRCDLALVHGTSRAVAELAELVHKLLWREHLCATIRDSPAADGGGELAAAMGDRLP